AAKGALACPPLRPGRACRAGRAGGDLVEPAAQRLSPADGAGLAGEDEEGGLEGFFRVMRVLQNTPADAKHQPLVTPDQQFKGRRVALAGEALQEFRVAYAAVIPRGRKDVMENANELAVCHALLPHIGPSVLNREAWLAFVSP